MTDISIKTIYQSVIDLIPENQDIIEINDTLFRLNDTFSMLIIEQSTKNIFELLLLFNQNINNDKIDRKFDIFFEEYSSYLKLQTNTSKSANVLKSLLQIIKKSPHKKIEFTQFIWSFSGFRNLIKLYPMTPHISGNKLISESIFCTIIENNVMIEDLDKIIQSFDSLIEDKHIHNAVIKHINNILDINTAYKYDNVDPMYSQNMTTFDICILMLNLVIKIMHRNESDVSEDKIKAFQSRFSDIFWKAIDIVYITSHHIHIKIMESLNDKLLILRQIKENKPDSDEELQALNSDILKGNKMLSRITKYINTIDKTYIDRKICHMIDNLIESKNFNTLSRLIIYFSYRTSVSFGSNIDIISTTLLSTLSCKTIPNHIKYDIMRLIMSHFKKNILDYADSIDILTKYIVTDIYKLNDLTEIHLIDIINEFSNTPLIRSFDIIELYMNMCSSINDKYILILDKYLSLPDDKKINTMNDLSQIIQSTIIVCEILCYTENHLIKKYIISYLSEILSLIQTICLTKQHFNSCIESHHPEILNNENISDYQNALEIFDKIKNEYVKKVMPLIVIISNNLHVGIDNITYNLLKNILGDNINELNIKVIDEAKITDEITDKITHNIAYNPYYISTNSTHEENLYIVDRKTIYNMYKTNINPFTREYIDIHIIDEFNETPRIKSMRNQIIQSIQNI
jgi:hypothetical protein